MQEMIKFFEGENRYLSNFYGVPVEYDGILYVNSEAAFQAQKTEDKGQRAQFAGLSPDKAKKLGRRIKLRPDWETHKIIAMYEIVKAKFTQNKDLGDRLIETGDVHLEEGNYWGDTIWGTVNGEGSNLLGKILMKVRSELAMERQAKRDVLYVVDSGNGKWYSGYIPRQQAGNAHPDDAFMYDAYLRVFNTDAWNLFQHLKRYDDKSCRIRMIGYGEAEEFRKQQMSARKGGE